MTITRVHHVQITIPEGAEEEGRRFYCGALGLRETPKPLALQSRGGFWLRVGDIEVHVGTEVTPELVEAENPDVVVLATGAGPLYPAIPGIDGAHVCDAQEILSGAVSAYQDDIGGRDVVAVAHAISPERSMRRA